MRPSDQVAARIRWLRQVNGWTAGQLAAECARTGSPEITVSVIANIETGRKGADGRRRRDVTVDEAVAFSAAFGLEPSAFLFDALPDALPPPPLGGASGGR